jgi:pentatricopeptide repeat protein
MEDGGRDSMLRELRGGGQGLREKDWRALILFVGTSLRSPRATPEVESAFSLFSQYMRLDEGTIGRDRTLKRRKQGRSAKIETYNALLHIAAKARSWELFENVEQRLASLGLQGDVYTVGIRMYKEDRRGAHVETVWNVFQEGLARFGAEEGAKLWNMMLWVLARRGMLKDAMRLYEVMRKGEPVDLGMLAPRDDPLSGDLTTPRATDRRYLPPPPEESTYARLIQAFAHRGDLNSALSIMRDMVSLSPPLSNYAPSTHIFTCLFRGFATYGFYPTPSDLLVSPRHLRGSPIRSNALASRESSFSPLSILGANRRSPTSPWSLSTLQSLFQSFLSLSPPSPPTYHLLPFSGQRTSPSAKELFWLVLAFEVLSGDDSELVLEVWKAVEETFGRGKRRDGVEAWTGWRADTRLRGKIERHQRRVEEWELERRELGE